MKYRPKHFLLSGVNIIFKSIAYFWGYIFRIFMAKSNPLYIAFTKSSNSYIIFLGIFWFYALADSCQQFDVNITEKKLSIRLENRKQATKKMNVYNNDTFVTFQNDFYYLIILSPPYCDMLCWMRATAVQQIRTLER